MMVGEFPCATALPSDTVGGLMTGLKALFCFTACIMFGGNENIAGFPLAGTLFGVGGSDGDCGTTTRRNNGWLLLLNLT